MPPKRTLLKKGSTLDDELQSFRSVRKESTKTFSLTQPVLADVPTVIRGTENSQTIDTLIDENRQILD
jgi:hypothetical protein